MLLAICGCCSLQQANTARKCTSSLLQSDNASLAGASAPDQGSNPLLHAANVHTLLARNHTHVVGGVCMRLYLRARHVSCSRSRAKPGPACGTAVTSPGTTNNIAENWNHAPRRAEQVALLCSFQTIQQPDGNSCRCEAAGTGCSTECGRQASDAAVWHRPLASARSHRSNQKHNTTGEDETVPARLCAI